MSSTYWLVLSALGLFFLVWSVKDEVKNLLVLATFSKPDLFKYVPYLANRATRLLIEEPQDYIERHPVRIVRSLEAIAGSRDLDLRYRAMQAIVENIGAVAQRDEGAAAAALLTVLNSSDRESAAHHRALLIRPGIIDSLAESDPLQAVQLALRGIAVDDAGDEIHRQSCELALRHLDHAFGVEPVAAAHVACGVARKTHGKTREKALWMLMAHMNVVTGSDFESGHAAAEQAALLSDTGTPIHQAAMGMWDWHIQRVLMNNPQRFIDTLFYGFGISTGQEPNKSILYEHGFDFLTAHPLLLKEYPGDILRISLGIGLRTPQTAHLYQKAVEVWTMALQELCRQDLHLAIQAATSAMTFTAPGSQFERQAQMAYTQLRRLDDDIAQRAETVFGEAT
jgi:hypothetical protein